MASRLLDSEQERNVCEKYIQGYSVSAIALSLSCSEQTISRCLKKHSISRRTLSEAKRVYAIDDRYFDLIDCQPKAYILGLLYADGCKTQNRVSLGLIEDDLHILEEISQLIGSNKPIGMAKKRKGEKQIRILWVSNKRMVSRLEELGVVQNKTFKIVFPYFICEDLYRHFVRGYMDGDGTIYVSKKRRTSRASIVGNESFCLDVQLLLRQIGVNSTLSNIKGTQAKRLEVSGTQQTRRFLDWIYLDSEIHLHRKHKKYREVVDMSEMPGSRKRIPAIKAPVAV